MFKFITGIKGYLMGGALLIALMSGGYLYWKNLTTEIKLLKTQNAIAIEANGSLQTTLERLQAEQSRLDTLRDELQKALEDATTTNETLQRILNNHDLEALSKKKPGLIEKRINNATQNTFDAIELDTAR